MEAFRPIEIYLCNDTEILNSVLAETPCKKFATSSSNFLAPLTSIDLKLFFPFICLSFISLILE
ncbi:unnamed protein product [Moneuplotes crassus]|uniref:Uncharacterized protein n=1 Tax=Euplotes crassus TaxID=5936 RepID=A0AAD1UL90_EUPCR|nr:unnamed protein product [Moneuplotes crassus]